jgi:uncharacterized protein (DUF427 family)
VAKASWNGKVIAESGRTEVLEGNHYFPIEDVCRDFLEPSSHKSSCPWKGVAQYYTIVVDGERNRDAAWYYSDPKPAAKNIAGRVAFWKGVKVEA